MPADTCHLYQAGPLKLRLRSRMLPVLDAPVRMFTLTAYDAASDSEVFEVAGPWTEVRQAASVKGCLWPPGVQADFDAHGRPVGQMH